MLTDAPAAGAPVYPHLDAARAARAMVVAPCSANTLAKLAHGLADNVLTESALALAGRLVIAPAMNVRMWEHPATQAAVELLRARGAVIVGPSTASWPRGRPAPAASPRPPTSTPPSSSCCGPPGRSPAAACWSPPAARASRSTRCASSATAPAAAWASRLPTPPRLRGAEVTTLLCNAAVRPAGGTVVETPTAADLEREALARAATADIVLMAAAVADYRPAHAGDTKRARSGDWSLELVPTTDILAAIGAARRPGQVLVGFAAETGDGLERARAKRERKGVDLIVLNDVARSDIGFEVDENEVALVGPDGVEHLPKASKAAIAAAILDRIETLLT